MRLLWHQQQALGVLTRGHAIMLHMQVATAVSLLLTLSAITAKAVCRSAQSHIAVQQEIPRLGIICAGYQGTLDSDGVGELL